ncbi:hypothetical protein LZQ00_16865 [Sphingobacterium sp. SRCM116780]|uniref:hypothetical protein n=1 Tax=Sphingobacterium sp. SRCM116780 TaxID=2907623 RepID=UPI001F300546|nr:hypothetical protein [Sphingobacterium sp. SRCM116780]UIR55920.1 hypothetical protein LZQ00_16865 [Sphingobacterium sp. SRCM116780]
MEINKEHELIVLSKVLDIIRFHIINDESSYLAQSPITTELYLKVRGELSNHLHQMGYNENQEFYIEDFPKKLEAIIFHIKNVENWNILTLDTRSEIVLGLIKPFRVHKETFKKLLK